MLKIKLDLSGKDAAFLSNCHRYLNGFFNLELYRNHPDKVPSPEQLKEAIDRFQNAYEGAANGDRIQIRLRKKVRNEVAEMFDKALHYLQSVADEDDIPALMQVGFELRRPVTRKKAVVVPAGG